MVFWKNKNKIVELKNGAHVPEQEGVNKNTTLAVNEATPPAVKMAETQKIHTQRPCTIDKNCYSRPPCSLETTTPQPKPNTIPDTILNVLKSSGYPPRIHTIIYEYLQPTTKENPVDSKTPNTPPLPQEQADELQSFVESNGCVTMTDDMLNMSFQTRIQIPTSPQDLLNQKMRLVADALCKMPIVTDRITNIGMKSLGNGQLEFHIQLDDPVIPEFYFDV